ncbi:MAG: hypothetical protein ACREK5_11865 [Gemmatimonadota bacterium]
MCNRATTEDGLARAVARRLARQEGQTGRRLAHVHGVVEAVREMAEASDWSAERAAAAVRAAWIHDALRLEDPETLRSRIEAAGEEPDPWALAHAPALLHAHAAAVWAAARGETDREVMMAVRHHPTAHPDWASVGRLLYVADFCEPGRPYAERLRTADLRRRVGAGREGLADVACRVLSLRLAHGARENRPVHPLSLRAWKSWMETRP